MDGNNNNNTVDGSEIRRSPPGMYKSSLCRRDRFKNSACTDKPINPPIGPFPDSAHLSVYRFIGAGHPDQPINR